MSEIINSDSEIIIAQNQEEWNRLLFLLKDPESNVLWINCDTARLKKPLHDLLSAQLHHFTPYDVHIDEKTESLNRIILQDRKDKIPKNAIIHVFGLEEAVSNPDFISNLNFQRDSFFRQAPASIIFWADFATSNKLSHKAYDFWSWIVFTFDFKAPDELLTARQKEYKQELTLQNTTIPLLNKDSLDRIRHLEDEWEEFLRSINGKPSTTKQIRDFITIAFAMAIEYRDDGQSQKVINILMNVLSIDSANLSEFEKIKLYNELGGAYRELGELEKAKEFGEMALENVSRYYGEDHTEMATALSNLCLTYWRLRDLNKAKEFGEKAVAIDIKKYGKNHPSVAIDQNNLGLVLQELGDIDKAKELFEESLSNGIIYLGENHPDVAVWRCNLAMLYEEVGEFNKAQELMESALNTAIINFSKWHPNVAIISKNLAHIYWNLNLLPKAKASMLQAYEIRLRLFGENHPDTIKSLNFFKQLDSHDPR